MIKKIIWTFVVVIAIHGIATFVGTLGANQEASIAAQQVTNDGGASYAIVRTTQALRDYAWYTYFFGAGILWGVWKPKKAKTTFFVVYYTIIGKDGTFEEVIKAEDLQSAQIFGVKVVEAIHHGQEVEVLHVKPKK